MEKISLKDLSAYMQDKGFIYQGSEIYGGLANSWDYGPLGVLLKNNIKSAWWKKFVQENKYNVGLDSSILLNPQVWVASGHVGGFSDPLIDCKECHSRFRADNLIENFTNGLVTGEGWDNNELYDYIVKNHVTCPDCGKSNFTDIRKFNCMFKTTQGVIEDSSATVYLRPETAQGIFINFKNVLRTSRKKVPFGIAQIGKSFRNEITPGNFIFRTREFEQMELEFFVKPGTEIEWFNFYRKYCMDFLVSLGIRKDELRYRDHAKEELCFYSNATTDIEYNFPWGFGELWGIASRTNYDLGRHSEVSKVNLDYLDPETNEKYIPYVVEPSVGVERILLSVVFDAYEQETLPNGDTRDVMHFHPYLAPYKAAILPLIKKNHSEKAMEIYEELNKDFSVIYDDTANIGKRYRREDAIGTPYSICVDDETLANGTVTVRDRDTMQQEVVKIEDLKEYLKEHTKF